MPITVLTAVFRLPKMFEYKNIYKQLIEVRNKNAALQAELDKTNANVDYIAMMTDIELEEESEDVEV